MTAPTRIQKKTAAPEKASDNDSQLYTASRKNKRPKILKWEVKKAMKYIMDTHQRIKITALKLAGINDIFIMPSIK
ncbi:hypothetical protein [Photobacterium gaetbulicola]|uniref:hypothetical protein n=1 Tax=Photobacterium gaetbulicola TaxID=1295392 RepID=UPI0012E07375|nr:hypothetical protein [Photobacterium gaetbulicola]